MNHETLKAIGDGAIVAAAGTGGASTWLNYVKEYDTVIGLFLTLFFGFVGILFYYLNWRKSIQADDNKRIIGEHREQISTLSTAFDSHKEQTKKEFQVVNSGISEILDKIK